MKVDFGWIGWNQTDGSDKIWGYIKANHWQYGDRVYVFWGRRGKTLSFKTQPYDLQLFNLKDSKIRKGYVPIDSDRFLELWPDFYEICELKLTWHIMAQDQ